MKDFTSTADTPETTVESGETTAPALDKVETDSPDVAAPDKSQEKETDEKPDKVQKRIDRLVRQREEARAEAAMLRRERESKPAASSEDQPDTQPRYTAEEVRKHAAELRDIDSFNEKCNRVYAEGEKASKTFADDVVRVASMTGSLILPTGKPSELMSAILDCDAPHSILSHLARQPDIAEELADMKPAAQIRRLAKLESELTEKPRPSTAPRPLATVKGAGSDAEPDASDTARWIAWRNKQKR